MAAAHKLRITEQSKVSPFPPPSDLQQSLPLTFFDIVFLPFPPVQRIFFYDYPRPKSHFFGYQLPNLKHSLSLALHKFYPLAGNLITGLQNPEIVCSGNDFVHFTVAVSNADFYELSGNHAREFSNLNCLVPKLVSSSKEKTSVFAIQVTVFPNTGVCVGTTVHHAVADGSTYTNFMKTWSSVDPISPSYDRFLICDPENLKSIFLKDLQLLLDDGQTLDSWDLSSYPDTMIATFVFTKDMLSKLGSKTSIQCSAYSLACGYIWSCLAKTRGDTSEVAHFGFVTGCRPRHEPPLPPSYFGNCLGICCVEAKRKDLIAENGEVVATEAIWKVIKGLEEGVFDNAEDWIKNVHDYANKKALTVAGSPKLGVYEIDFGWGRPKKVEIISIEQSGALSLAESGDEKGGIEVGLVLPKYEMERFISIFVDGIIDV